MNNLKHLAFILSAFLSLSLGAKIIGQDNRLPVISESEKTKGLGVLYASFSGQSVYERCTATAIGPDHLITAAHCVYDLETNKFATSASFLPGLLKSALNTSDRYFIEEIHVHRDYASESVPSARTVSSDIAILKVKRYDQDSFKDKFGTKTLKSFGTGAKRTNFYAYPGDKADHHSLYRQHDCSSAPNIYEREIIESQCDTVQGMSGGALLDDRNNIIAINSSYAEDSSSNFFSKISSDRMDSIKNVLQNGSDQLFKMSKADATPFLSAHFRNDCAVTIYIAAAYFELGTGETIVDGYFPVKPGRILYNVFQTDTTKVAFYAQDESQKLVWSAPDHRLRVRGETKDFYREELPSVWKDKTFTWACN